ncbi:hypothetical protein BU24DRAFT_11603 [Aaosphaeria arxii CBS 175.79]|uniref:Uncharacterized protein n=1 Tax=Aaosphaeria arxii CBS 175.79 TaxID=1450172 RepID=A0A6A5Y6N0_9PLEO|nr:uncharacterized protein BU24DRAFT_11603 [Aaosphaeria arxii CBS 175.79]KAF2020949.1 hypothetical protein BU24DRAFT_11603 [Aaosphaeria arxii CBS 175.79]
MISAVVDFLQNGWDKQGLWIFAILLISATTPHAHAQLTAPTLSTISSTTTPFATTIVTPSPTTTAPPPPHLSILTTLSTTFLNTNSTSSISTIRETDQPPSQLFPLSSTETQPNSNQERNESAFNYYFLILAGFGAVLAVGLWWIRKRRKRQKEQMRLSGQTALARDLDGWVNTRRWVHGAWRHNQTVAIIRREEGLDENGEPPPPYHSDASASVPSNRQCVIQQTSSELPVPLRTISREDIARAGPPAYPVLEHHGQNSTVTSDSMADPGMPSSSLRSVESRVRADTIHGGAT